MGAHCTGCHSFFFQLLNVGAEKRKKIFEKNHLVPFYHQIAMNCFDPMQVNKCKAFGVNVVQHGQHILEAKDHATNAPQFKVS